MAEEPSKALAIAAHPDGAEFICEGTVARWCAEGWEVKYVLATSGDMGTRRRGWPIAPSWAWPPLWLAWTNEAYRLP